MFPNSSWLFFCFFLLMQRKILCHICPSKVPTLIHLARGENLRWMPPRCLTDASQMSPQMPHGSQMPLDVFQMPPRCLPDVSPDASWLSDASQMPPQMPDASQMSSRCLPDVPQIPDVSQMSSSCFQDASQMAPPRCFRKPCLGSCAGVI